MLLLILLLVVSGFTLSIMSGLYTVWELGGTHYISTYTVSFYALGNALGIPLGKPFADRFGYSKVLIITLCLFSLFTLLCATSSTLFEFLLFRTLQGIAGGFFYLILARLVPKESKEKYTLWALTIFAVGPIVGACFGGFVAYEFHWTYIFYAVTPIPLILAWFLWKDDIPREKIQIDFIGYFFFALGIFSFGFALTTGEELDWFRSNLINASLIIALVTLPFFVLWTLNHPNPLFDFGLFKHPVFTFGIINLIFLFSIYFGMIILLSLWLTLYVHYSALWIGVLMGIMAVAGILPSLLVHHKRFLSDARIPLALAFLFLIISSFHTATFSEDVDFYRIAVSRVTAGLGLVLFLPPLFRLCFRNFEEQHASHVLTLFQVFRALSSGLGASIYTTLWHRREIFYHDRLGGALTPFSEKTAQFFAKAQTFFIKGTQSKVALEQALNRQATSLALDDSFFLMGWILVGLVFLLCFTFFLKKKYFYPETQKL